MNGRCLTTKGFGLLLKPANPTGLMPEEETQEATLFDAAEAAQSNPEIDALKQSIASLEKKNYELIGKLKKAPSLPEGVDIQSLLDFKANAEQAELEKQGKYTEARTKLEEQFRERLAEKDKSIGDLESRVRELELISPAVSALAEVVHDPNLVLNNFIPKDKIEIDNGVPVVNTDPLDGPVPIADWVKKNLAEKSSYLFKQDLPRGGGAPAGRSGSTSIPPGTKNPFAKESFNLTEQSRLYKTDKGLYDRLLAQSKR